MSHSKIEEIFHRFITMEDVYWSSLSVDNEYYEVSELAKEITALDFFPQDIKWLQTNFDDSKNKWFALRVVELKPSLLPEVYRQMLKAGVDEVNPSANKFFIEPCNNYLGYRKVNGMLFDIVRNGTDFEKAGAVNALYWSQGPMLMFRGFPPEFTPENAIPETVEPWEKFEDIRHERMKLFLKEFIDNKNIDVRRSIISQITLDSKRVPVDLHDLYLEVLETAKNHEDGYVRGRVGGDRHIVDKEVKKGKYQTVQALPYRIKENKKSKK